jgi:hypothetical protein
MQRAQARIYFCYFYFYVYKKIGAVFGVDATGAGTHMFF